MNQIENAAGQGQGKLNMPDNIRKIIEKYGQNYMGVLKFGTDEEKKIVTKWFGDTIQRLQDEKACD